MSTPPSQDSGQGGPTAATPIRPLVIAAAAGVLVTALVVAAVWLLVRTPTEGPEADAAGACAVLGRYDADLVAEVFGTDEPEAEGEQELVEVMLQRYAAASALAEAAASADDEYADLSAALLEAQTAVRDTFDWGHEDVLSAVERAEEECDSL